jgi:hypothetical protein
MAIKIDRHYKILLQEALIHQNDVLIDFNHKVHTLDKKKIKILSIDARRKLI